MLFSITEMVLPIYQKQIASDNLCILLSCFNVLYLKKTLYRNNLDEIGN